MIARRKPIKRGKPPKRVNVKRKASEFARCFGSRERVQWIKSRLCVVTWEHGDIENVHVRGGGGSRRADACWIVPMTARLHRELHRIGKVSFECQHAVDLDYLAELTEAAWLASLPPLEASPK